MRSNAIALTAVISEKLRQSGTDNLVAHNHELMFLLDMSKVTFQKTRRAAVAAEFIVYTCRGTVKAGSYALHPKWVDMTHLSNSYNITEIT